MDNPCKTCHLSTSEKAACCGCPKRLKWERDTRIKTPKDQINYAVICEKFPIPHTRFSTQKLAERWAKLEPPGNSPFYIVKCTEHYEICSKK